MAEAQGEALGVGAPLGVAVSEGVAVGDVRVLWECEGEGEEQGLAPASEAVGALEEVARGVADTVGVEESEGVTVEEAEREKEREGVALPAPTVLLTQEVALSVLLLLEDTLIVVLEEAVGELEAALTVAAPL